MFFVKRKQLRLIGLSNKLLTGCHLTTKHVFILKQYIKKRDFVQELFCHYTTYVSPCSPVTQRFFSLRY